MATSAVGSMKTAVMNNMNYQLVDGVNYLTFGFASDIAKHLEVMRGLEMRDDDVFCVGFPRAGNHLVYEMVHMILHQEVKFAEKHYYTSVLELMGDSIEEKIQNMLSPRYFSTHHRVHRLPLQVTERKLPIIYLMRNPKDILVSMYRLLSSFKDDAQRFKGSWNDFFELQMAEEFPWGSWFGHVLAMGEFLKDHPECPVYIFSFEKMKVDSMTVIKELCSFLGRSDDIAEAIAAATDFANMKKVLREGKMKSEEALLVEGSDALFRKGGVGGWKEVFTVAQNEAFNRAFKEKMVGCKLADLVCEYI